MQNTIDLKTTRNFSYGLFVLLANDEKQNGCIINTAIQVTSEPFKVSIAVNKNNYTLQMILKTKKFNLSTLTENAPFDIFKRFGFQSGKEVDKFENFACEVSSNGINYLSNEFSNSFISCDVETFLDLGTHYLIVAKVTEAKVLSNVPSATYAYYFENIKPKPQKKPSVVYKCLLCGYEYNESVEKVPFSELPSDWTCPLCGADKSTFALAQNAPNKETTSKKVYVCTICGYEYDENVEKVPFSELPDSWVCPLCKHPKSDFELKI